MPKVPIHGNQLTLPDDLRQALTTEADDALDAEVVDEGILLRRSASARRHAGWADIEEARAGVRYTGPRQDMTPEEEEQYIADLLYADKLAGRQQQTQ